MHCIADTKKKVRKGSDLNRISPDLRRWHNCPIDLLPVRQIERSSPSASGIITTTIFLYFFVFFLFAQSSRASLPPFQVTCRLCVHRYATATARSERTDKQTGGRTRILVRPLSTYLPTFLPSYLSTYTLSPPLISPPQQTTWSSLQPHAGSSKQKNQTETKPRPSSLPPSPPHPSVVVATA